MSDNLTLAEASELTRISSNTLRWFRAQGTGPRSFKLGRRIYYRRADLEQYLADAYEATVSA